MGTDLASHSEEVVSLWAYCRADEERRSPVPYRSLMAVPSEQLHADDLFGAAHKVRARRKRRVQTSVDFCLPGDCAAVLPSGSSIMPRVPYCGKRPVGGEPHSSHERSIS